MHDRPEGLGVGECTAGRGGGDLGERGRQCPSQAEIGHRVPRRPGEERLRLGGGDACRLGREVVEQDAAAVATALGVDGHAGRRQGLHVPKDRTFAHLELVGEPGGRHAPVPLQQHEETEESVGAHVSDSFSKTRQYVSCFMD